MRIALIDPSLFTLPYDSALQKGFAGIGQEARLFGRSLRADETGQIDAQPIDTCFYPVAESSFARRRPKPVKLAIKGVDHAVSMMRLLRRLRGFSPGAIHFQWFPLPAVDALFLPALRRIAPVVLTVHDTEAFNGNPTARLQRLGFFRALAGCQRLIVHTRQGRDRLARMGIEPRLISQLPHGPLAEPRESTSPDPMLGRLTFVLFGKLKPYKGADLLVEAFARLPPDQRARARLHIVGQAYMDISPLVARLEALGLTQLVSLDCRFVAEAEMASVFGPGTVAVFPYREIEASGVLSLAIAHGRPIIASRLGSFTETLEDGVHGRLTTPGDVVELSDALAMFITNRNFAASAASAVFDLARRAPGWCEIARKTLDVYAEAGAIRQPRVAAADFAKGPAV